MTIEIKPINCEKCSFKYCPCCEEKCPKCGEVFKIEDKELLFFIKQMRENL